MMVSAVQLSRLSMSLMTEDHGEYCNCNGNKIFFDDGDDEYDITEEKKFEVYADSYRDAVIKTVKGIMPMLKAVYKVNGLVTLSDGSHAFVTEMDPMPDIDNYKWSVS